MEDGVLNIEKNLEKVLDAIGKTGRDVTLIAVTKTHSADSINRAIDWGVTDIGENKVQEILDKHPKVKDVRWHMIGHLQTNKVRQVIDKVNMIHSVDSIKIAKEIDKRAKQHGIDMDVLIQVNPAMEESKFGLPLSEVESIIDEISTNYDNVKIRGLMAVLPIDADGQETRKYFSQVKNIYDRIGDMNKPGVDFQYLSMGMSNDFVLAIEEGSNMVRVGSAIFGDREY